MLAHRLRCWISFKTRLVQCVLQDLEPMLFQCWPIIYDAESVYNEIGPMRFTRLWTNAVLILVQRLGRCTSFKTTLFQRLVFAKWIIYSSHSFRRVARTGQKPGVSPGTRMSKLYQGDVAHKEKEWSLVQCEWGGGGRVKGELSAWGQGAWRTGPA